MTEELFDVFKARPRVPIRTWQNHYDLAGMMQRIWIGNWNMALDYGLDEVEICEQLIVFAQEIIRQNKENSK